MGSVVLMRFKCKRCDNIFFGYCPAFISKKWIEDTALELSYPEYKIVTPFQTFTSEDEHIIRKEDNNQLVIFNKPIENKLECRKCRKHGDLMQFA